MGRECGGWPAAIMLVPFNGGTTMNLHLELTPLLSIVAGIAILIVPRLLNYIVAAYLIIIGVIGIIR
jgi:hypothetical protein